MLAMLSLFIGSGGGDSRDLVLDRIRFILGKEDVRAEAAGDTGETERGSATSQLKFRLCDSVNRREGKL